MSSLAEDMDNLWKSAREGGYSEKLEDLGDEEDILAFAVRFLLSNIDDVFVTIAQKNLSVEMCAVCDYRIEIGKGVETKYGDWVHLQQEEEGEFDSCIWVHESCCMREECN